MIGVAAVTVQLCDVLRPTSTKRLTT